MATMLAISLNSTGRQYPFSHGLPSLPSYFPIAVWLQDPSNASRYKAAGFNLYIGLWQGPTDAQLARLKAEKMPVICEQNAVGLSHRDDRTIVAWMHGDEPDNAQAVKDPVTGKDGYGPCVPPTTIVDEYRAMRAKDPTRPIILNLGQGVANDEWIGRGSGARLQDYKTYVKGADIVSFDVYPVAGLPKPRPEDYLWYVPKGLDRLASWMGPAGTRWNCIECTRIDGDHKATPAQVRSEVWMSIVHGSKGLIYFVHQFKPTFDEHALLDDPEMLASVTALNRQIEDLAPIINSPTLAGVVAAASPTDRPVDIVAKRHGNDIFVFAVGMRNAESNATFSGLGIPATGTAQVIGEDRTISIGDGRFSDRFSPYEPHIYRIRRTSQK